MISSLVGDRDALERCPFSAAELLLKPNAGPAAVFPEKLYPGGCRYEGPRSARSRGFQYGPFGFDRDARLRHITTYGQLLNGDNISTVVHLGS